MLQVKNLVKIYKPKKGVPVKALDDVSLTFPQTGMVFLLGKSGSGKSTLLNILGGLDRYNSGDILIQGKSTKKFTQSHFDSYRNTYVGFIFQEYNILEEFSVGANIALALQLQGHKADDEKINAILRDVDLEGYGSRKPNELSGGQKQRVAIARALVKNPKIIMADEPTGALDSATGRQVLATLKKLSRDKLVIVVSHDREFAEQYGDRIIELSDGRVIRDVEKHHDGVDAGNAVPVYMEDSVSLPEYYTLTEADKSAICQYIQSMVSVGKEPKFSLVGKDTASFQPTDERRIRVSQEGYHLIKSRLPMKYAFKLGASSLKYKKFRLVMTVLLSCVALVMFGLADTLASFSYVQSAYTSLTQPEGKVSYAAFKIGGESYYYSNQEIRDKDITLIQEETGLTVYPVYKKQYEDIGYRDHIPNREELYDYSLFGYNDNSFAGYFEITQQRMDELSGKLVAGRLPQANGELAISTVVLEDFLKGGYAQCEIEEGQAYKVYENANGEYYTDYGFIDENGNYVGDFGYSDENYNWHYKWGYYEDNGEYRLECSYYDDEGEYRAQTEAEFDAGLKFVEEGREIYYKPGEAQKITDAEDMLGKTILLGEREFTVCGVVDTGIDLSRYEDRWDEDSALDNSNDFAEIVLKMAMRQEMSYCRDYSLAGMAMVAPGQIQALGEDTVNVYQTLSAMPESSRQIRQIVEFSSREYRTGSGSKGKYMLMNPVSFELQNIEEIFTMLSPVFLGIGIAFAIFASLLFSNFIAVSISYKKVQIGILRAIGSRGNDVFRIFFAESFCIAMINFVLSVTGTFVACGLLNNLLKSDTGLLLSILNVSFRQVILLLFLCLLVAAVASFLPVKKIASKRPIDAIRDR